MHRHWSLCGIYNEPSFPFFSNFRSLEAPQFNVGKGGGAYFSIYGTSCMLVILSVARESFLWKCMY